jgi:molybdopterin-guanine dinucleotide biosynthesis protein
VSHKIAVVGLPGAGKTTLITALFELVQRGTHLKNVRLHGLQTIETVNRNIARLNSGERIGPTKEKDVFIFRFSYLQLRFLIARSYDVEIADFPGEYSERIPKFSARAKNKRPKITAPAELDTDARSPEEMDDLEYTLFKKEFFSWIASPVNIFF